MTDPTSGPGSDPQPDQGAAASDRSSGPEDALIAALMELERHVGSEGWDQAPRLFALVSTDAVIAAEPELAANLGLRGSADGGHPDALTAIEQDHFQPTSDLLADLSTIFWPETVHGCALSLESTFLPAEAEADIPDDPDLAREYVANHELQQEMRVVVGVDRGDHRHGVARIRSQPDDLLGAEDLVPGLTDALAHTLAPPPEVDPSAVPDLNESEK